MDLYQDTPVLDSSAAYSQDQGLTAPEIASAPAGIDLLDASLVTQEIIEPQHSTLPESHSPLLVSYDEQPSELGKSSLPEQDEYTLSYQESPVKEEAEFNFEKELPAPPCVMKQNEQDLLMNFSASHFQEEETTSSIPESPSRKEEFDAEIISKNVESESKAGHQEEEEESQPEEECTSSEVIQVLASAPVMEQAQEKPPKVPEHSSSSSINESPSRPLEPVTSTEEIKTRSVKSSKYEAERPTTGGLIDLSHLNACVVELIYWRDPRKSGVVFGSILAILLSLSVVSFISVVSYASLAVLAITLSFRLYKNVLQAVQKTQDGHPFKEYLEIDVTIPSEKVHEVADLSAARLNAALVELRRLFLVEDLIDSFKFGLALWSLTYVGAWFNGITLVILAFIGLFAFPKVYETHQEKIDQNVDLVRGKINEIVDKVTAVLPIGKKPKSQ
jgi:membrane protein implicated in regulation of membrane protease activity